MEITYEEILKSSEDLVVGDEISVGDTHTVIEKIQTNNSDQLVLHLHIIGFRFKSRSKIMLIIPKKIPIVTLK